jgi:hypothetical protein
VLVERPDGLPEELAVMGKVGICGDGPATGDLQIDPAIVAECGRQPPRGPCRGIPLPDVGELHRQATSGRITGRV